MSVSKKRSESPFDNSILDRIPPATNEQLLLGKTFICQLNGVLMRLANDFGEKWPLAVYDHAKNCSYCQIRIAAAAGNN